MTTGWLSGWKSIASYCGGISVTTARKYHRKYGLPVRRLPGGQPVAIQLELDNWLVIMDETAKKRSCPQPAHAVDTILTTSR